MNKPTTWKIGVIFTSKPDVISTKEFVNYRAMADFIKTLKRTDKVKTMASRQWKTLKQEKKEHHLLMHGKGSAI